MRRSAPTSSKQISSRPSSSSSTKAELVPYNEWEVAEKSATASRSPSDTSDGAATLLGSEASGVDWNMAGAGVRLWLAGRQREEDRNADPAFMRSIHIDALKYMHAALPNDLTPAETDAIVGSLPAGLRNELEQRERTVHGNGSAAENNMLRKAVSDSVCSLTAIVIFLLPFLMNLFHKLLKYEREHRWGEKALSNGVATVNALGEHGLDFKDSRIGSALLGTGIWIMDGFVGGVNDGLMRSTRLGMTSMQIPSRRI